MSSTQTKQTFVPQHIINNGCFSVIGTDNRSVMNCSNNMYPHRSGIKRQQVDYEQQVLFVVREVIRLLLGYHLQLNHGSSLSDTTS